MTSNSEVLAPWDARSWGDSKSVSYIMTTLNKLEYLRESVPRILEEKRDDEELLIVDGMSNDGSTEYLEDLARQGKIDWLLTEKDLCEAHALNKAILASRGKYITILTDDDVYCFDVLRDLRAFLEDKGDFDVAYPSGGDTDWNKPPNFFLPPPLDAVNFRSKVEDIAKAYPFSGLGLTFRRASIPKVGLFDLNFKRVDMALTYRLTDSPVRIAMYAKIGFVRILNEKSITLTIKERNTLEKIRLHHFYRNLPYEETGKRNLLISAYRRVTERLKTLAKQRPARNEEAVSRKKLELSVHEKFVRSEKWLRVSNARRSKDFVLRIPR